MGFTMLLLVTSKKATNSASSQEKNTALDHGEIGPLRDLTSRELSALSLRATSVSTDPTYSEWESSPSNSMKEKVLPPLASLDLSNSPSTGERSSPSTRRSRSLPLPVYPSPPRLDSTLNPRSPTSRTVESSATSSETSTSDLSIVPIYYSP